MTHIIQEIGTFSDRNNKIVFNCINSCNKNKTLTRYYHNANEIKQRLENAAKIKTQLEADTVEINSRIKQSAEARKNLD